MNIKEKYQSLPQSIKKNIQYWVVFIGMIDILVTLQHVAMFAQNSQCRNYLNFGSVMHVCSFTEFAKFGWQWLSVTNVLVFLPMAVIMVMVSNILDVVFAKKD